MPFITKTDLVAYIELEELDKIIEDDDTKLDRPMLDALSLVRGELSHRYDVDQIFANPDNEAYAVVKKIAVDIALFYVYSTVQTRHIPEHREEMHDRACVNLQKIAIGNSVNGLPLLQVADGETNAGQGAAFYDEFKDTDY